MVVDPFKALEPGAPVLRTDKKDKKDNRIFHWEAGDRADTDKAFAEADVMVKQNVYIPRIHVASIETCGCIADFDPAQGKLTVYMTTQAPHAIRTVFALVAGHVGLSEERIRIVSPDIGGGFGGKVPVYPGYVIAVAASVVIGKPVKWIEDRMENLQADSFARDYHMTAELAAKKDGTMTALRIKTVADHGYADASANPSKFPAGLFSICTGSYDLKHAFCEVDGVYTNKPPGGSRLPLLVPRHRGGARDRADHRRARAEAEDGPRRAAHEELHPAGEVPLQVGARLGVRQRQLRRRRSRRRWTRSATRRCGRSRRRSAKRGELMGIGISSFTEIVGAGPSKHFDILGIKMFDCCEIRVHPTGKAIARFGTKSQGQGHETTYAQIVAEELGIPASAVQVEEGDTDTAPYGLGTYASRSTPTAGAAGAMAARKIRDKARKIAAHLLEVSEDDLEWEPGKFSVKGAPQRSKTIQEIAFAAYTNHPQGMEAGLEAVHYYDPPNLTFPFGSYICVVDIDRGTGEVKIRRFVAVDDCGNIINPMIVDGQIHGGLTMGMAPGAARGDQLRRGRQHPGRQLHGLPRSHRRWRARPGRPTRRSRRRRIIRSGRRAWASRRRSARRRRSRTRWWTRWRTSGCRHIDIPITPEKVWQILKEKGSRGVTMSIAVQLPATCAAAYLGLRGSARRAHRAGWAWSLKLAGEGHHGLPLWARVVMWTTMMVGMMVPPEVPTLLRLAQGGARDAGARWGARRRCSVAISRSGQRRARRWRCSTRGSGHSVLMTHEMASQSVALNVAILVAAGLVQLSPWKLACLDRCRSIPRAAAGRDGAAAGIWDPARARVGLVVRSADARAAGGGGDELGWRCCCSRVAGGGARRAGRRCRPC